MAADTRTDEKLPGSDLERGADTVEVAPARSWARTRDFLHKAATFGRVEVRGITPIPVKERTVERTVNIFTLWWSMNTNILG